jgi:hypothetical protein
MYWLYLNLRRQVIWKSVTVEWVQKFVEVRMSMFGFVVHLAIFGKELASI